VPARFRPDGRSAATVRHVMPPVGENIGAPRRHKNPRARARCRCRPQGGQILLAGLDRSAPVPDRPYSSAVSPGRERRRRAKRAGRDATAYYRRPGAARAPDAAAVAQQQSERRERRARVFASSRCVATTEEVDITRSLMRMRSPRRRSIPPANSAGHRADWFSRLIDRYVWTRSW